MTTQEIALKALIDAQQARIRKASASQREGMREIQNSLWDKKLGR